MTRFRVASPVRMTLAIGATALGGCDTTAPESPLRAEIDRNRTLWLAEGPTRYGFALERQCFCGREARGPVYIEVAEGRVLAMRYVDDGTPVDSSFATLFPTILGLFEELEAALDLGADRIEVAWDESSGVPLDIFIDLDERTADEEYGLVVTEAPSALPLP